MPGLNLMGSGQFAGGVGGAGSIPHAAGNPAGPRTIGTQAFGITSSQTDVGPRTAGFGTVALGIAGIAVLVFLWKSLPR